jgi:ribosomal protein S18 acetylase RimI-like enzyme
MESVTLGVDAENVTGARHLYERYGFEVVGRQVMYRASVAAADPAITHGSMHTNGGIA